MSILKNAIQALDPTPDKTKELSLALNLLFELAEQKKNLQEEWLKQQIRTAGTPENPSIPITNTLAWLSETRAYVKSDAGTLVNTVTGAIKKFIDGGTENVMNGVGELITGGLNAILGSGTGAQSEMHSYFIVVEAMSIIRFDITAWQRRIDVAGITAKIENAMTLTAVKSSVDVDKISFNTFLQAYKSQLAKMKFGDTELIDFIKKSKEVFELLQSTKSRAHEDRLASAASSRGFPRLFAPGEIKIF
ncbi:MAG TPA: hypothetical protein VGD80_13950 [Kofleriaceae bacterium]